MSARALLCVLFAIGCGDASGVGKTFSVTGKVTLDDRPLTAASTIVLFKPDATRGNTSLFEPAGTVDDQGHYVLFTNGKKGAPPGWYQVVVTATEGSPVHPNDQSSHRPVAKSLVPAKYGLVATSGLSIEVVKNPDPNAYDLNLTK